jgi:hypothetical protein
MCLGRVPPQASASTQTQTAGRSLHPFFFLPKGAAVRKFYLRDPDGWIVSFVTFDPVYEAGDVIGYSPAVKRRSADAPAGAEEAITKYAIEQFRAEGIKTLRLGLLPFYQVQDSAFRESWRLKKLFQWLYDYGDRLIYSFRGHADFKHGYRGNLSKVYFGTYTRWNALNLFRSCDFVGCVKSRPDESCHASPSLTTRSPIQKGGRDHVPGFCLRHRTKPLAMGTSTRWRVARLMPATASLPGGIQAAGCTVRN